MWKSIPFPVPPILSWIVDGEWDQLASKIFAGITITRFRIFEPIPCGNKLLLLQLSDFCRKVHTFFVIPLYIFSLYLKGLNNNWFRISFQLLSAQSTLIHKCHLYGNPEICVPLTLLCTWVSVGSGKLRNILKAICLQNVGVRTKHQVPLRPGLATLLPVSQRQDHSFMQVERTLATDIASGIG